jgi:hypothetical protein
MFKPWRNIAFDKFCHAAAGTGDGGSDPGAGTGTAGAGAGGTDWRAAIPEGIRSEAVFANVKDVGDLATQFFNGQKLIGVPPDQLIRLAGADDKAAWDGIYNKLGRPESADKYQLTDPAEVPAGLDISAEGKTAFAAKAHEFGLSQRQADSLYQWLNGDRIGRFNQALDGIRQSIDAVDGQLRSKWGGAYEQKSGDLNLLVDHLSRQFGLGSALREAIDATGGDNGVAVRTALAEVGALMREHQLIKGDGSSGVAGALTPAEAQQQINAMWADRETATALRDQRHPGHGDAVAKMGRLYGFAFPETA